MTQDGLPFSTDLSYTDKEAHQIETNPIQISLCGHTCAGKTEWLSGLLDVQIGEVSPHPDNTVNIAWKRYSLPDRSEDSPYIQIADVPGQELSDEVFCNAIAELGPRPKPSQMEAFIKRQKEIEGDHKSDIELLDHFRKCDANIYLADCQNEPMVAIENEFELVRRLGKPVIAVLNFSGQHVQANRDILEQWREAFEAEGAQSVVELDAFDKAPAAIRELGEVLVRVFNKNPLKAKFMRKYWQEEIIAKEEDRLDEALDTLANFLTDAATFAAEGSLMRGNGPKANERKLKEEFQKITLQQIALLPDSILQAYPQVTVASPPAAAHTNNKAAGHTRHHAGLFGDKLGKQVPKSLGRGAIIGGLVGLVGDVIVGGLSGGGVAALGAAIGATMDVGFSLKVRKTRLGGLGSRLEIQLADKTISTCCMDGLALIDTIRRRGRGNTRPIDIKLRRNCLPPPDEILNMLKNKRSKHSWSQWAKRQGYSANRQDFVDALAAAFRRMLDANNQSPVKSVDTIAKIGIRMRDHFVDAINVRRKGQETIPYSNS